MREIKEQRVQIGTDMAQQSGEQDKNNTDTNLEENKIEKYNNQKYKVIKSKKKTLQMTGTLKTCK